jgi:hypothetical protein
MNYLLRFNRIIFIICFFIIGLNNVFAQQDTSLVSSSNLWQLNDTSFLFRQDTINELWIKDKSLDIWQLNNFTEILTYDNDKLRIWRQGSSVGLWFYAKEINDWKMYQTKNLKNFEVNDSINYSIIDDSTKLVQVNGNKMICYISKEIFLWNNKLPVNEYSINDTIQLQHVNDTVNFWKYKDSTILWYLTKKPKIWEVSHTTVVWTIDPLTEFWKAGDNYKVWRRKSTVEKWEQDEKILPKRITSDRMNWMVNDSVMVWNTVDSVQIWKANKQKRIWNLKDSIYIWEITFPKIDTSQVDTLSEVFREVKKAEILELDKSVKLWSVNDSVKLYSSDKKIELWSKSKNARQWKLTDSTLIWNLNPKSKLSLISDSLTLWQKNDSTFVWEIDSLAKPKRLSKEMVMMEVNDSLRYTQTEDSTTIWDSNSSAKIATLQSVDRFLILNDTTELWEPNDSTKLWIDTYNVKGDIWEKNKQVNILNINDSTKIWQLNEDVRLSIINGKLRLWQQGKGDPYLSWKESRGFKQEHIRDTIKIWHIDDNTVIWESKEKIEVWNKNKNLELYRLNDTSLLWTYSAAMVPKPMPKPTFWTFAGSGKMDLAQVWVDQWAKGGENSLSTLFILTFQANYNKKKVKWNNDFEYHYGFLKPGDQDLRKNEDKIKISNAFNYYAINRFYYGFTSTLQTQFFKGYKYEADTSYVVSDWAAPLYYTAALGLNYFPVKQLSVFFSPITNRITYVRDTVLVNQENYGVPADKKIKNEPGLILKSSLNWDIAKNININSKLDLFTSYQDLKKYNVEWETTFTFKFNEFISTTLNTHLIYDPNVVITDSQGNETNPVQFKEVLSIGLFYKI